MSKDNKYTGNPYEDDPGKGFVPVKGYHPPAGSQAESIAKQEERAAETARRQAQEDMQRAADAQLARDRASAVRREEEERKQRAKREEQQRKMRAKREEEDRIRKDKAAQKKALSNKSAKSVQQSSEGNPMDTLITLAGGGGGLYLAYLADVAGMGLLVSAAIGAGIAYLLRGVIKGLLVIAILLFIAAQFFGS